MTLMTKFLAGGAAIAAMAAPAPASAQYYQYPSYGYGNQYGYGYNQYAYNPTAVATQRCTAAVQARLNNRTSVAEIIGAFLGANTPAGRVTQITRVNPNRSTIRVRGLASSGRFSGYGPYGVGAYGALGYAYNPDLKFSCSVDYRGYVRDVDISRR